MGVGTLILQEPPEVGAQVENLFGKPALQRRVNVRRASSGQALCHRARQRPAGCGDPALQNGKAGTAGGARRPRPTERQRPAGGRKGLGEVGAECEWGGGERKERRDGDK